jgi:hypothetical protein
MFWDIGFVYLLSVLFRILLVNTYFKYVFIETEEAYYFVEFMCFSQLYNGFNMKQLAILS